MGHNCNMWAAENGCMSAKYAGIKFHESGTAHLLKCENKLLSNMSCYMYGNNEDMQHA
jgi:hypothetical protein